MVGVSKQIDWRSQGLRYFPYSLLLRERFGHRVQKVSIDAGFHLSQCGTDRWLSVVVHFVTIEAFSPSRRIPRQSVRDQIDVGIEGLKRRYRCDHFVAYFQPATNTYAEVDVLRALYQDALAHPQVIALSIGTRPDCVPDEVLELLEEIAPGHLFVSRIRPADDA